MLNPIVSIKLLSTTNSSIPHYSQHSINLRSNVRSNLSGNLSNNLGSRSTSSANRQEKATEVGKQQQQIRITNQQPTNQQPKKQTTMNKPQNLLGDDDLMMMIFDGGTGNINGPGSDI